MEISANRLGTAFLCLGFVALLLATLAGYLGSLHWILDLFSHFRPQLSVATVGFLLLAIFLRRPLAAGLASILLLANLYPLWPYLSATPAMAQADRPTLRAMTFNLQHEFGDLDALEKFLERHRPTFVLLTELPKGSGPWLANLKKDYPYQALDEFNSPFDLALISRWPLTDPVFDRQTWPSLPVLTTQICPPKADDGQLVPASIGVPADGCVSLVGLHAANPLFGQGSRLRDIQLRLAAEKAAASSDGAVLMMGDLNATPWSPIFGQVEEIGGLRDSARGFPLSATWVSRSPLIGLQIDHVLLGSRLQVNGRHIGQDLGSDHFPVLTDIVLR